MQLVLLALLALADGQPSPKPDDAVADGTGAVANQHVAVSVLSAMYYCENNSWPENIEAVQAFHEKSKVPLPVQPDWTVLGADGSSYAVDQDILTLTTAADARTKAHKITTTNKPPGCAGQNLDVKAAMHIGE